MKTSLLFSALALFFLASSGARADTGQADRGRILVMGDSLLAVHSITGRAVSNALAAALGEKVVDRSVLGARVLYALPLTGAMGLNIPKQYRDGDWDWVVVNGGGNDLWLGCGCHVCTRKLNKLISDDGRAGRIAKMVQGLRGNGARVIYVGYLRSPGLGSPIEECKDEGDILEARISAMAAADSGIFFLSLVDLVPHGDRSYHAVDMIHPSLKASAAIGRMVAELIRENE